MPWSRLSTGCGIIAYVSQQWSGSKRSSIHVHVRRLPTTRTMSADCAAVAARRRFDATQSRLTHARHVSCRWRWAGLDGKVDASESQTLARAPGPRGANGTCASHVETKRETKHLHGSTAFGGKRDVHVKPEMKARRTPRPSSSGTSSATTAKR